MPSHQHGTSPLLLKLLVGLFLLSEQNPSSSTFFSTVSAQADRDPNQVTESFRLPECGQVSYPILASFRRWRNQGLVTYLAYVTSCTSRPGGESSLVKSQQV
ncbi:uncharacterized protein RAG0_07073 [Rhynchosporium agropyri]|uniref:Uncharacterized protein n=1 Tax=Rhynchosporium agropyri TaxID=914238 RepID=A0A1E1KJT3_9HELO|nr:uncharacterized protein RAG0_07073 [Rhynchosporium agropyri]